MDIGTENEQRASLEVLGRVNGETEKKDLKDSEKFEHLGEKKKNVVHKPNVTEDVKARYGGF